MIFLRKRVSVWFESISFDNDFGVFFLFLLGGHDLND